MVTLFELIKQKLFPESPEQAKARLEAMDCTKSVLNPLNLKIGKTFQLDVLDYRGRYYNLTRIIAVSVIGNRGPHHSTATKLKERVAFTDYEAVATVDDKQLLIKMRMIGNRLVLLNQIDSVGYSLDIHKLFIDDTNDMFDIEGDQPSFKRMGVPGYTYVAKAKLLEDSDNNGVITENEISSVSFDYWDFSREASIDGVALEQFLFVDLSLTDSYVHGNRWFTFWKGMEIQPYQIL